MKYSIILIVVGILQVSATGYAQNLKVSIDITNGTIYDVVTEIEKQTGMTFFYKDSDISPQHAVTVKVRNKTVPEVLDRTIKGTDLAYGFNNRCIILTKKEFLATALVSQQQQQQGKRITGKVIDGVTGEPIIGANVVEKGTTNGTSSDSEGGFYITVRENATLQVSYLGYKAVEVSVLAAISGQTFEIKLFEDTQALEEVVVVGYGVQQKRDLTGSIVNVKGEKIKNIPVVSAANALQGRVTGVDFVTSDGRPGEQPNIRIRGTGTINGAEPLVVIDGIP
ncbi:MAG: carboxypeptidase-like regulatory domain-containing protein, partial [Tannerella sp.]|nr:carboxypeptidase-like regulatory domain-containing protein [Tannerella sp.]